MRHLADLYASSIMRRALLEALLVGALCGAVGVHVLLRRLPFFTVTVAHASFPGVVVAVMLGLSVLVGAIVSAAVLVLAVWLTGLDRRLDTSTTVGVALAGTFGIGVMLQSTQAGFTRDLTAILVGQILAVDRAGIVVTAVLAVAVLGTTALLHKELVLSAFDPTEAAALGYSRLVDLAALGVVAAAVVTTVPTVGVILSVALLTVPAMSARLVTRRVGPAMTVGAAYGATAGAVGLTVSAEWDVAAGAAIVLSSAGLFAATLVATSLHAHRERRRAMLDGADRGSRRRARRAPALG
jgi:ABC-type Mn2+/Zn2+ transport system permease subunit